MTSYERRICSINIDFGCLLLTDIKTARRILIYIRYVQGSQMSLAAALFVTIFGISLIAMPFFGTRDASAQIQQQRVQSLLASFSGSLTASSLVKGTMITALNVTGNNTISISLRRGCRTR